MDSHKVTKTLSFSPEFLVDLQAISDMTDMPLNDIIEHVVGEHYGIRHDTFFNRFEKKYAKRTTLNNTYPDRKRLVLRINEHVKRKLDKICLVENTYPDRVVQELIWGYEPVPVEKKPGVLKSVCLQRARILRQHTPGAFLFMVTTRHPKLGQHRETLDDYNNGLLTWDQYTRAYLDRLKEPDAQAEIRLLQEYAKTRDVYITSFEGDDEKSLRRLLVDYANSGELNVELDTEDVSTTRARSKGKWYPGLYKRKNEEKL